MNFTEYINQENPRRLPFGSVVIKRNDVCVNSVAYYSDKTVIVLYMFGQHFWYYVPTNSKILLTQEGELTCFSIEENFLTN